MKYISLLPYNDMLEPIRGTACSAEHALFCGTFSEFHVLQNNAYPTEHEICSAEHALFHGTCVWTLNSHIRNMIFHGTCIVPRNMIFMEYYVPRNVWRGKTLKDHNFWLAYPIWKKNQPMKFSPQELSNDGHMSGVIPPYEKSVLKSVCWNFLAQPSPYLMFRGTGT